MTAATLITAGAFAFLALAHSVLGEVELLRPLFAAEWTEPGPRWAMERIFRFAWHLTSICWIAIAAIALDAPVLPMIAILALLSSAMIFVMLRGHLAWPVFLLGGLAAWHGYEPLPQWMLTIGVVFAVAALVVAAAIHVAWASGMQWGLAAASPTDPGNPDHHFEPGPGITLLVAVALVVAAVGVSLAALNAGGAIPWLMTIGVAAVLTIRAIGDTRVAGLTKTVRDTEFAAADDRIFTPLCVFIALGAGAALML